MPGLLEFNAVNLVETEVTTVRKTGESYCSVLEIVPATREVVSHKTRSFND